MWGLCLRFTKGLIGRFSRLLLVNFPAPRLDLSCAWQTCMNMVQANVKLVTQQLQSEACKPCYIPHDTERYSWQFCNMCVGAWKSYPYAGPIVQSGGFADQS